MPTTKDAGTLESEPGQTLWQKLLAVQKSVPYLEKENSGVGLKYKYVSSSQVLEAIRSEMDRQGLLLLPEVLEARVHLGACYGGKQHLTELVMRFTWINADNPTEREVELWYGQGVDDGEKGVGKAQTYAEKYLLLKMLHIATDKDDPDAFQGRHEEGASNGHQAAPAPARAPARAAAQQYPGGPAPAAQVPAVDPATKAALAELKELARGLGLSESDMASYKEGVGMGAAPWNSLGVSGVALVRAAIVADLQAREDEPLPEEEADA